MFRVSALWMTPVKGMRIQPVDSVELTATGAVGNRRFHLVDHTGRMINGKVLGSLQTVTARCEGSRLELDFGAGDIVGGEVRVGDATTTRFFSREVTTRPVIGPWSDAITQRLGKALTLVEIDPAYGGVDRGADGGVSLISTASLSRLDTDPRRFRMLVEVEGPSEHEEDGWVGHEVRIGEATVEMGGHVGRCLVTGRNPDSGVSDVPMLDILRAYRRDVQTTERVAFGIHGRVIRGGTVRLGDTCTLRHIP